MQARCWYIARRRSRKSAASQRCREREKEQTMFHGANDMLSERKKEGGWEARKSDGVCKMVKVIHKINSAARAIRLP